MTRAALGLVILATALLGGAFVGALGVIIDDTTPNLGDDD